MGMNDAENSSKTVDFFIFCKGNASDNRVTQDDDVSTIVTSISPITEISFSNDTTQGKMHPYFCIKYIINFNSLAQVTCQIKK